MIYEIAEIEITPGTETLFEAAVRVASAQFRQAQGCRHFKLERGIENPGSYRLVVAWDSVDDHMVEFRNSEGFEIWRQLASPFFTAPPKVTHVRCVLDLF